MKIGFHRHALARDYYDFARRTGCILVVARLAELAAELPAPGRGDK